MYKAATGIPLYRRNGYLYRQLSAIHGELYDNYIHVYIYVCFKYFFCFLVSVADLAVFAFLVFFCLFFVAFVFLVHWLFGF